MYRRPRYERVRPPSACVRAWEGGAAWTSVVGVAPGGLSVPGPRMQMSPFHKKLRASPKVCPRPPRLYDIPWSRVGKWGRRGRDRGAKAPAASLSLAAAARVPRAAAAGMRSAHPQHDDDPNEQIVERSPDGRYSRVSPPALTSGTSARPLRLPWLCRAAGWGWPGVIGAA